MEYLATIDQADYMPRYMTYGITDDTYADVSWRYDAFPGTNAYKTRDLIDRDIYTPTKVAIIDDGSNEIYTPEDLNGKILNNTQL